MCVFYTFVGKNPRKPYQITPKYLKTPKKRKFSKDAKLYKTYYMRM